MDDCCPFDDETLWAMGRLDAAMDKRCVEIEREEDVRGNHKKSTVCRYWLAGRCLSGLRCRFVHCFIVDQVQLCAYIDDEKCPHGADCIHRHYYLPGERSVRERTDTLRVGVGPSVPP